MKAVFPESSINPKLAQAIARQTGATSDHTLYGDTLGPKGSSGATYLSMERANADAMVRGFTGGARGCSDPGTLSLPATLVRAEALAAGYGAAPVLTEVSFALHAGERMGVLGPNGGGKTTLFRVLLGELAPLAGTLQAPARFAVVPQTERSRLDFPVSALDVALMGSISTLPWWRRPGRARAPRGAGGARARSGSPSTPTRPSATSRAASASACSSRARSCRTRAVILLDEPFTGLDAPSAERLEALLAELAAEGRGVMIATHDVDQARGWDRVLCLNRRQVAFGPPASTLDRDVLEATYGGAIVELPGGRGARRAPTPPPLMLAALHTLTDPWADPVGRRALLEVALLGVTGGALGCWIVFYNLSYSAESLAHALLPGLVVAALTGMPLLLGGAAGLLVAARRDRGRRPGARHRPRHRRRGRGDHALRRRRAARALAVLAARAAGPALRRRAGRVEHRPRPRRRAGRARPRRARAAALAGCWPSASIASARPGSACARSSSTSRCSCSWRSRCSWPCRAWATCSSWPCSSPRRRPRAWSRGAWGR